MDWLAILGIVVSIIGVVLSLIIFNASVNNGRKIILNNVMYEIDRELFYIYNPYISEDEKIKYIDTYVRSFAKIDKQLNEINYKTNIGIPLIQYETTYKEDIANQTFKLNESLKELFNYFMQRNIQGVDLLFDFHNDRFSILQMYSQKRKYIRRLIFGPIIGMRITAVRKSKEIFINKEKNIPNPVRKIKNQKDLEKYYNQCYLKFAPMFLMPVQSYEMKSMNFTKVSKKGKERPITMYY